MAKSGATLSVDKSLYSQIEELARDRSLTPGEMVEQALDDYVRRQTLDKQRFPYFETQLRGLVREHLELKSDPLLLAVYYAPEREPQDLFLFEVIENFGMGLPSMDKEFYEVTIGGSDEFPLGEHQRLHLLLTDPDEMKIALREGWTQAQEIRDALQANRTRTLHCDVQVGKSLLEQLRE